MFNFVRLYKYQPQCSESYSLKIFKIKKEEKNLLFSETIGLAGIGCIDTWPSTSYVSLVPLF